MNKKAKITKDKTPSTETGAKALSPLTSFRAEMDDLIENFFGNRYQFGSFPSLSNWLGDSKGLVSPSVEIDENDQAVLISAELPGMDADDVEVNIRNHTITLKGEKKTEREEDKDEVHICERRYGSFQRSFNLPDTVDEEAAEAKFDKGLLTITLPKKEDAQNASRRVEIK